MIDPAANYPSNISNELLQVIDNPATRVKTISRSLVMNCENGNYDVLGASLWDKKDNYIAKDAHDILQQKEFIVLPKYVIKKLKSECVQHRRSDS